MSCDGNSWEASEAHREARRGRGETGQSRRAESGAEAADRGDAEATRCPDRYTLARATLSPPQEKTHMATPVQIVTCPHCSARVRAPADVLGRRARCARCGKTFILSAAPSTAQPLDRTSPPPGAAPPAPLRFADEDDRRAPAPAVSEEPVTIEPSRGSFTRRLSARDVLITVALAVVVIVWTAYRRSMPGGQPSKPCPHCRWAARSSFACTKAWRRRAKRGRTWQDGGGKSCLRGDSLSNAKPESRTNSRENRSFWDGGRYWTRTSDLYNVSVALCRLS